MKNSYATDGLGSMDGSLLSIKLTEINLWTPHIYEEPVKTKADVQPLETKDPLAQKLDTTFFE
jgi:hypothetical protein